MGMSLTLTVINWSSSLSTLAPSVASGSVLHTQRRDTCSQSEAGTIRIHSGAGKYTVCANPIVKRAGVCW
jgi:hypothetical protein